MSHCISLQELLSRFSSPTQNGKKYFKSWFRPIINTSIKSIVNVIKKYNLKFRSRLPEIASINNVQEFPKTPNISKKISDIQNSEEIRL